MEQCIEYEHKLTLIRTPFLAGYTVKLVKEANKICLHPNNFNRDSGFTLIQAWHPLINVLNKG
jgi:hypothetical protein